MSIKIDYGIVPEVVYFIKMFMWYMNATAGGYFHWDYVEDGAVDGVRVNRFRPLEKSLYLTLRWNFFLLIIHPKFFLD